MTSHFFGYPLKPRPAASWIKRSLLVIFTVAMFLFFVHLAHAQQEQECFQYTVNATTCPTPPCFFPTATGRPIQTSYLQWSIITDVVSGTYAETTEVRNGDTNFQTHPGTTATSADKIELFNGPFQFLRLNVTTCTACSVIVGICGVK